MVVVGVPNHIPLVAEILYQRRRVTAQTEASLRLLAKTESEAILYNKPLPVLWELMPPCPGKLVRKMLERASAIISCDHLHCLL